MSSAPLNGVPQFNTTVIYLPGSRPSYFENEGLSLTPATRITLETNLRAWDADPFTRWKSVDGTRRNERAIHDLTVAETQFKIDAADEIAKHGYKAKAIVRLQSNSSPLDRVNALLEQSNLPITLVMENAEVKASRDGKTYSVAKMSDGERAAVILSAQVVAAPTDTIFIIDEPEVHLHRAITAPLITSILRERTDCSFLISTHELELPAECPDSKVVMVRSCLWQRDQASWDIDVIDSSRPIPDDLRIDILGSRRKILFVEGINGSLDRPLYALLFPTISVRSRESCREVERSVSGLRGTEDTHHVQAFGLIDNDGMDAGKIASYEAKGIYPLPVHAVESLYYAEEIIAAVAARQAETLGVDPIKLTEEAATKGLASLDVKQMRHLASRVAERQMREALLSNMPERTTLLHESTPEISVTVRSPFPTELARIQDLHAEKDLHAIISHYPVRESGVLDAIAKSLKFPSRSDYEKAALARLGADGKLQDMLRAKLGPLASLLL